MNCDLDRILWILTLKTNLQRVFSTLGGGELSQMQNSLHLIQEKYPLHPILYFYGFGNGILYKALLQNKNLNHCVILEQELEILYLSFHLLDFSKELESKRMIILYTESLNETELSNFYNETTAFFVFCRTFVLEIHSQYYQDHFSQNILATTQLLTKSIANAVISRGNDPLDALEGIENYVHNLTKMITNPAFKELIRLRKAKAKTAIIVSTGPSLTKQLTTLKEVQEKAVIFCADSAYSILAKNGIVPDYVCMVERSEITAEFFHHDFGRDFDKNIIFLCTSLIDKKAIEYLEKYERKYILVQKLLGFNIYCDLKHFSYFDKIASVAHLCLVSAMALDFENIIFIGQDLAFGDTGDSHPKEYQYKADYESYDEKFEIQAYKGQGTVLTHRVWRMFLMIFNLIISESAAYKGNIYNATEGGVRIETMQEKPFKELCEKLLNETKPVFEIPATLHTHKQNEFLFKAYAKVLHSIKECHTLSQKFQKDLQRLQAKKNFTEEQAFKELIQELEEVKNEIKALEKSLHLYEILSPFMIQFELNLARIYVFSPKNSQEALEKKVTWIDEHFSYIDMAIKHCKAQELALRKNILVLEKELQQRGFKKQIIQIKRKVLKEENEEFATF
ncbi:motility associated factor glycosyltransferase family protein [Campylobacter sp. MIT 21-1684]|uniref:motility associated factor glycosyltransferase family protein n=1 Tax=Campylobacter sp. MIT 21-1684 TaxID=2994322 RepID=UPI00224AA101|nr:motility associated factor glycosyltransferase family protein [Campylobacter sp. MIT 21-1684]MCX2683731.1 motility associated factor glycosyltransferase family protein [Campylobacter sp. MIT 21-1684]